MWGRLASTTCGAAPQWAWTNSRAASASNCANPILPYHPAHWPRKTRNQRPGHAGSAGHSPAIRWWRTYPNADTAVGSSFRSWRTTPAARPWLVVPALGFRRYLSALSGAAAMVGNSSSGIIEAPAFGVPTVNLGARQLGRLAADSVLHCAPTETAIAEAITTAVSPDFAARCKSVVNPYGQGDAAGRIVRVLETHVGRLTKHFHDMGPRP
ncbi:UDP-N-acetylglucosamine 2-epimerase [Sphaerotilus sp.]|uniref:UDP-N-acetylglucosamine 2-epimerase n=1 Tax=Sphaerotilus sp. TaxID=2093942 RepID=UPI002ACD89ED|nr:UDP-N-acetylglucosamine 2-epimerase [Sphaerotilus sp.]MDZ7857624.1 UDP-N-acetylglucosamine 2-epimerase [Sphaerotilus sp.]